MPPDAPVTDPSKAAPPAPPAPPAAPAADPMALIAQLQAEIAALKAGPNPPAADPELHDRARKTREDQDRDSSRTKQLEQAITFNLKAQDFVKSNASLLPKEAADIFAQAERETFNDAIEKDSAIKSGLIQSFFAVQANVDLLTSGQKASLDEYLKLTKTGKQDRAQQLYDMVFEPAFEMLKRTKRAEALSRGHGSASDVDQAYKERVMNASRKHYLGEKHGS